MMTETDTTLPQVPEQESSAPSAPPVTRRSSGHLRVEKRRETRYAICEQVDVYLLDMNNLRLSGVLRDISKSGMRIELDMPLKAGDRMEVLLQNKAIVFAEVRYCRRSGDSYQVGSVIDDVYYPKSMPSQSTATQRASSTAGSEIISKQVTQHVRWGEKRPADSEKRAVSRSSNPAEAVKPEHLGTHVDRNDINNLLGLRLSETKAALLERHLASCDQCLDLVLLTLEERASEERASPRPAARKSDRGQI